MLNLFYCFNRVHIVAIAVYVEADLVLWVGPIPRLWILNAKDKVVKPVNLSTVHLSQRVLRLRASRRCVAASEGSKQGTL